jgi:hypothetical protein
MLEDMKLLTICKYYDIIKTLQTTFSRKEYKNDKSKCTPTLI